MRKGKPNHINLPFIYLLLNLRNLSMIDRLKEDVTASSPFLEFPKKVSKTPNIKKEYLPELPQKLVDESIIDFKEAAPWMPLKPKSRRQSLNDQLILQSYHNLTPLKRSNENILKSSNGSRVS
jgi:hypothetical protein